MTPEQIILAFMASRAILRDRLLAAVEATYRRTAGPSDEENAAWLAAVVPLIVGGQGAMAALTNSYMASLLSVQLGTTIRPVLLDPKEIRGEAVRGGVSTRTVYDRPMRDLRTALADQRPYLDGFDAGLKHALDAADTDLALTHRAVTDVVLLPRPEVIGSRRILTPPSCGVCVADADRLYPKGKRTVRLHARCDCTIASVTADDDPGPRMNAGRSSGGISAVDHDHDELGPVITDSRYHFAERTRLGEL